MKRRRRRRRCKGVGGELKMGGGLLYRILIDSNISLA